MCMLVCAPSKERERERKRGAASIIHFWEGYICTTYEGSYMIYIYTLSKRKFLYIRYLNKKKIFNESTYAYTHTQNKTILCFTHYDSKVRIVLKENTRACVQNYIVLRIFYYNSLSAAGNHILLRADPLYKFCFSPFTLSLSFLQRLFDEM